MSTQLRLESDPSARFLPWVIAVMVFLAALAMAAGLAGGRAGEAWRQSVSGRLTVYLTPQAAPPQGLPQGPPLGLSMAERLARATAVLQATPGVVRAEALDRAQVEALLLPWLGAENLLAELPLPGVIDVRIETGAAIDLAGLNDRLAPVGAIADDPARLLDRAARIVAFIRLLGFTVVGLIALATLVMVVFATRAGLAAHDDAIEVLHVIGATDRFIARQFERHVLTLALQGGIPGLVAAVVVIYVLGVMAQAIDAALLPAFSLSWWAWAGLAALPLGTALLATVTARLTVLGNLRATI
jgi:cell division transport system permease protein